MLHLTGNKRSVPGIAAAVDAISSGAGSEEATESIRKLSFEHPWAEAAWIRDAVQQSRALGLSCLVLSPRRRPLLRLAAEFEEHGVPFTCLAQTDITGVQEVRDAIALLTLITRPSDTVSLYELCAGKRHRCSTMRLADCCVYCQGHCVCLLQCSQRLQTWHPVLGLSSGQPSRRHQMAVRPPRKL